MRRDHDVPYTVEQDENGAWCAAAEVRPGAFANGQGDTREEALADLREAIMVLNEAESTDGPASER